MLKIIIKLLKYLFIALIILLFVNYFRNSSEEVIDVINKSVKDGISYNNAKNILDKYSFVCRDMKEDNIECTLNTSTKIPLASCEHRIFFMVINNEYISSVNIINLCAGL